MIRSQFHMDPERAVPSDKMYVPNRQDLPKTAVGTLLGGRLKSPVWPSLVWEGHLNFNTIHHLSCWRICC